MFKTTLHFEQIPVEDVLKIASRPTAPSGCGIRRHAYLAMIVRKNERAEKGTLARALRTSCR
jgi:hypothetical protein